MAGFFREEELVVRNQGDLLQITLGRLEKGSKRSDIFMKSRVNTI